MESQTSQSNNNSNNVVQNIVLTLDNCLFPKDKIENPPSLMDGMDENTETELRIKACELIQTAGILLKLPQVAMATGQVLFQRFYYCKSFVRHPADVTAMGCVCLASKIEEAPRRIRDVINVFHHIRQVQGQKPIEPLILDQHYIALKTQVIKAERRILKELGFCVHVRHPHKLIVMYLQVLGLEKKYPGLLQMSWNYMNDSLRTNVFVEYSPETVACACIFLSARKLRIIMPKNPDFYVIFGTKEEDMLNICRRILKLYKRPRITLEELEDRVKELRTKLDEERERNKLMAVSTAENTPTGADRNKSPVSPTTFNSSSKSQIKKRSRSRSKSKLKSRSPVTSKSRSDSSSPSRHRKLKRNKEYNHRASHKTVKASSYKRTSGSPSPSKSRHHKKYKHKHEGSPRTIASITTHKHDYHKHRSVYKEDRDREDRNRDYYRHHDYKKKHKR